MSLILRDTKDKIHVLLPLDSTVLAIILVLGVLYFLGYTVIRY